MINNDAVVRTNYHKYFHPKECLISNGVLNRAISQAAGKSLKNQGYSDETVNAQALQFVYPYGATLNVAKPAIPVLSTGSVSFPLNRPVCAFYTHPGSNGKLVVVGSGAMFSDQYIDKEDNHKIKDVIFDFLMAETKESAIKLNEIDAEDPEISDYNMIPDTCKLADSVRVCLQESDEIPADYTRLFEHRLFSISTSLVPSSIRAYDQMGVKHDQLRLISPQFETPLPPLAAAVFPPTFRELPNTPPKKQLTINFVFLKNSEFLPKTTPILGIQRRVLLPHNEAAFSHLEQISKPNEGLHLELSVTVSL